MSWMDKKVLSIASSFYRRDMARWLEDWQVIEHRISTDCKDMYPTRLCVFSSPFCEVLGVVPAYFKGSEGDHKFEGDSYPSDEVKFG